MQITILFLVNIFLAINRFIVHDLLLLLFVLMRTNVEIRKAH